MGELVFKEDGQEYAQVTKMLGNGRLEAMCFDGVKRLCHIRGKLRKKVWINQSDIILVGLRDYQDAKADVIQKYSADEARNLKSYESSLSPSRSMRRSTLLAEIWMTTSSSMMSTAMTPAVTTPMTLMEFNLLICPFIVAF